jgi:tripartite-type tricarboxylate transporter receptor subunit TctC
MNSKYSKILSGGKIGMFRRTTCKTLVVGFIILLGLLSGVSPAAEVYPSRPITVVNTWGPGMSDTIARIICRAAEKELGQPIIVENKPGAGGAIGMNYVLKAKPDGYTLGVPMTSAYVIHPHIRKLQYNPLTDTVDITTIFKYNFGIAVKADAPWNTYEDVIAYARNNPGKFTYSTAGVGVTQHICMEQIAMKEGIKWTQVPFKSGSEAVVACLGGTANAVVQGSVDEIPHLQAGKLKLLLTLEDKRWRDFPDVPTITEKGYNFYAMSFMCLNAPKGVGESIVNKLEAAFNKAKKDPVFMETLRKFHVEVGHLNGKEYSELWRSKYEEMGKVIKLLGISE